MRPYRDLLKHGATYGVGQLLGRLASFLLLPLYTRLLRPEDYGVIAVLDLVAGVLAIVVGAGMVSAVNRFHFDAEDPESQRAVWGTGTVFVGLAAAAVVLPMWLLRGTLAHVILGPDVADGSRLFGLAIATLWLNTVGSLPEAYLRVRKWSGLVVVISLGRLVLNVGANVWMLVAWGWGVEGVLWGNLLTAVVISTVLLAVQAAHAWPLSFDAGLLRRMLAFGAPLIVTSLLALVLHDADRYLLRVFAGMEEVGIYSVAYKIGQAVSTLLLAPFSAIWSVSMYEIAALPDGRRVFARVFERFVHAFGLVMLAAALFARPLLALLVPDSYAEAADIVPVICLAYLLFALHTHFNVPVLLSKSTRRMIPVFLVATVVNIAANVLLIPRLGAMGAAWASVASFAAFSLVGLLSYRRLDRIPYNLAGSAALIVGWIATYFAVRLLPTNSLLVEGVVAAVACGAWTVALFGAELRSGARMAWDRLRGRLAPPDAAALEEPEAALLVTTGED